MKKDKTGAFVSQGQLVEDLLAGKPVDLGDIEAAGSATITEGKDEETGEFITFFGRYKPKGTKPTQRQS